MKKLTLLLTLLLALPIGMLAKDVKPQKSVKAVSWKSAAIQSKAAQARTRAGSAKQERIADMGTARAGHQVFASGNSIVVVGGHTTGYNLTPTAEIYKNSQWGAVEIGSSHDNGFSVILSDGRMMVGGGHSANNGEGQSKSVDIYAPSTQTFSKGPDLSIARAGCNAAITSSGDIYVAGNWKADDKTFDYYDGSQFQSKGYALGRTAPYLFTNSASDLYVIAPTDNNGNTVENVTDSDGNTQFPCYRYKAADGETYYLFYPVFTEYKPLPLPAEIRNTDYYSASLGFYFMLTRSGNDYMVIASAPNRGTYFTFDDFSIPTIDSDTNATINWRGGVFFNNAKDEFYIVGSSGSSGNYAVHILTYKLGDEYDYWVRSAYGTFDYDLSTGAWALLNDGRLICTGGTDGSDSSPRKDAFIFAPPVPDTGEGESPTPGDSWQAAGLIEDGSTFTGSYLSDERLEDWYKIELPEDGTVTLIGTPQGSLKFGEISIFANNQNSTDVEFRQSVGATSEEGQRDTLTVIDCKPGTYYIKVARRNYWMGGNGEGTYTLSYNFTPDPLPNDEEANDTWSTAKRTVQNGETVTGHLGYYYYYGGADRDVEDWYIIDVPSDGQVKMIAERFGTLVLDDIALYSLNQEGTDVAFRKRNADTLTVEDCQPGRYYIRVARGSSWIINNGNGSYRCYGQRAGAY